MPPSDPPDAELIDALPVAVIVTDAGGEILRVNGAATELFSREAGALVGETLNAVVDLGPGAADGEHRGTLRRADGIRRVIQARRRTLGHGRVLLTLHDVTATAAAEDELRTSVQQLLFVANTVPALLAYIDKDARYVWGNHAYQRWFDQSPDSIRGRHLSEVLGLPAWEALKPHAARAIAGEQVEFERRIVYTHGPARDIRAAYVPDRDAGGQVRGFIALVTDVSEARRAEQALRRSERLLVESQTAAHVGSWEATFDEGAREPTSLWWSDEAFRIFGHEPGRIRPTQAIFMALIHPDDRDGVRATTRAGIERGGRFEKEYRIVLPDGSVRTIFAWTTVEKSATGQVTRLLGTCQDVTDRLAEARERELALQELKDADRRKDEFLAMLSHELRNPLAPILSAVEILKLVDPRDAETSARYRAVIEQQVHLMKRLLDDLLDVARVSQGKIELRKEVLDLGKIVERAVEVSRPLLSERNQWLTVSTRQQSILVIADPTRLVQVFANLLNNAAKYSEHGGRVQLDYGFEGAEAIVRVSDEGVGMTQDLLTKAFDLFVQETRSLDRSQGGLGIGLTMVRSLVQMHGGTVRAFSDGPGKGTEVVVRLPLAQDPTRPLPVSPLPAATISKPERPLRILVVDDNADAARTLGELLKLLGHNVTIAADGPSALAAAAAAAPELVLIDIGLPGMDGYALASALRAAGHDLAGLVAVTGYGRDEDIRRSTEAGFDDHLVKPVDVAALQRLTLARARAPALPIRS